MFADDPKCYRAISKAQDVRDLQCDFDRINKWCQVWRMTLNQSITRNMGQDGDGHAHFDQIWRPNITINYMGVDQNIKF